MGNFWGDLWGIMMTEQAFLAQRPVDVILVQFKMKPTVRNLRN